MLRSMCNKFLSKNIKLTLLRSLSATTVAKSKDEVENVTVVGGGVMGSGIAQCAAQSGFQVTVVDNDEYTQKCMVAVRRSLDIMAKKKFPNERKGASKFIDDVLSNITTTGYFAKGCTNADLVIEAVVENLEIKQGLMKKIEETAPDHAIIASNTSSLSLSEIASVMKRPDRFGGLHFFNPVWKMQLLEVIQMPITSQQTFDVLVKFGSDLRKKVVKSKDTTGFIVNRLLFPYMMGALRFYERGHATIPDIDTAMKLGVGYPMGPFELIDHIGVDVVKSAIDGWHENEPNNPLYFPSDTLNKLAQEEKLGRKTGQGFYKYKHVFHM